MAALSYGLENGLGILRKEVDRTAEEGFHVLVAPFNVISERMWGAEYCLHIVRP